MTFKVKDSHHNLPEQYSFGAEVGELGVPIAMYMRKVYVSTLKIVGWCEQNTIHFHDNVLWDWQYFTKLPTFLYEWCYEFNKILKLNKQYEDVPTSMYTFEVF